MTATAFLLLALALAAAAVDWLAVARDQRALELVAKPATMVALGAVALAVEPSDPTQRTWWLVALAWCLAGDVFLMLRVDRLFVAGLAAFLVGHLAYVVGFWVRGVDTAGLLIGVVVVSVALGVLAPVIVRGVRRAEPSLAGPVLAYMAAISLMVASAFGTGLALAVAGALLFYASDALIALTRFVTDRPWGRLAVIVTYHLGQVALVLSLL